MAKHKAMALYEIPVLKIVSGQQTREQITARLTNIDLIIERIESALLESNSSPSMVEYELDTGQTKTRVKLASASQMVSTLETLDKMRGRLVSKITPRVVQLIPISSVRNNF